MEYQENRDNLQQFVADIARALVDAPSAVIVEAVVSDELTVLRLHVAPEDVGKVIGKQGRTARSMRTILSAVSMKMHRHCTLDIVEEGRQDCVSALMPVPALLHAGNLIN